MQIRDFLYPEQPRYDLHHVFHRGSGLSPWTLSWNDLTVFKPIVPPVKVDGTEPWCAPLPDLVRNVGRQQHVSFLNAPASGPAGPGARTPYDHVRQYLLKRTRSRATLPTFLSDPPHQLQLPRPRSWRLMQGILYLRGNHDFTRMPGLFVMLLLPPSAWRSMDRLLADSRWQRELLDPQSPTMLMFYQAAWHAEPAPRWPRVHEVDRYSDQDAGPYGANQFLACLVRPASQRVAAVPPQSPIDPEFIPWQKVIRRLSVHEQLSALALVLGSEPVRMACAATSLEPELPRWVSRSR